MVLQKLAAASSQFTDGSCWFGWVQLATWYFVQLVLYVEEAPAREDQTGGVQVPRYQILGLESKCLDGKHFKATVDHIGADRPSGL